MNFFHYILVVCLLACANADVYKDCGSKLSTIENVQVSGCDGSKAECILKRNTNVSISIDLTPNTDINKVNTVVHGIMMGMPVPFPMLHPDACENTGLTCPLKPNEKYSYVAVLPVLKTYPKVNVEVKWELQDENKNDIVCLMIPAKIN